MEVCSFHTDGTYEFIWPFGKSGKMFSTYLELWQEGNGIPYYTMATPELSKAKSASGELRSTSYRALIYTRSIWFKIISTMEGKKLLLCETVNMHVFHQGFVNNLLFY